jgi:hypothetical protein
MWLSKREVAIFDMIGVRGVELENLTRVVEDRGEG